MKTTGKGTKFIATRYKNGPIKVIHYEDNKSWEELLEYKFPLLGENENKYRELKDFIHSTLNKETLEVERITEEWYEKEYIPKAIQEERNRLIEKVEQRINTKQHICSFNDGESACACYNQAISDILTILKEGGKN